MFLHIQVLHAYGHPGSMPRSLLQNASASFPNCSTTSLSVEEIYQCINAVRTNPQFYVANGMLSCRFQPFYPPRGPLKVDFRLEFAAKGHAMDMANMRTLTHQGSDGSNLEVRVNRAGYLWSRISEIIGVGFPSTASLVAGIMCNPSTLPELMGCQYADMGVGLANATNGQVYFTQLVGCKLGVQCQCPSG